MPYVQRDSEGNINGMFANMQPGYAEEYLPDDNPEVVAFQAAQNIPPPVVPDANARIDAGIAASVLTAVAAAAAIHAIPQGGALPIRFEALLVQMKTLSDAFVNMLQAEAAPPP